MICHFAWNAISRYNRRGQQADFTDLGSMIEQWPDQAATYLLFSRSCNNARPSGGAWMSMTTGTNCEIICREEHKRYARRRRDSRGSCTFQRQPGALCVLARICASNTEPCRGTKICSYSKLSLRHGKRKLARQSPTMKCVCICTCYNVRWR